ncbi:conserved hypothetical protein [Nostocoides japonicum T1-X7]|uniref:Alpha/beta hydrolase n=1 Tax=Nostocoides japonicum T1-X7 TaxID=1194083 RepID=A0A077LUI4_9MICO|nr:alpha/beta hydrolase [Tetrasphaera japonica]CCH76317.1 conserved hypothetical protein [Tetrasphaera japonica T1-X7]
MTEHTDHLAPEGLRTRGTVVVVPGRGESPATYRRFADRLAADAYRVRVVAPPAVEASDIASSLERFGARLGEAVTGATTDGTVAHPVVLVGADLGAAVLAALTDVGDPSAPWWPDGLVLAGLPGRTTHVLAGWEHELDARSHCPVHRGILDDDPRVRRGALGEPVPDELLNSAHGRAADLPQLVVVGDADPLADRVALARSVRDLSLARLSVVRGAHHDVLNDLQHRSVAAEVVTFLEALRTELVPAVTVESSAW